MALLDDLIAPWLGERRAYWLGPYTSSLPGVLAGRPSSSGVALSETGSLTLSAVWCAVTMITGCVASLPLFFYRRTDDGGRDKYIGHPNYRLMHDEPNAEIGAFGFRELLTQHVLLWGNAYAEIQRDESGRVVGLWPITPDRVAPFRDEQDRPLYRVTNYTRPDVLLKPERMFHLRGLGFDGLMGYSVIRVMARDSMGLTFSAQDYGGKFYKNGAHASWVAQHPGQMGKEAQRRFKESVQEAVGGDKAFSILVVEEGVKIEKVTIPPDDAQFLETRQFQTEEVARWFNIPPHKIKDLERSTNNNIEQQAREYLQDTMDPWLMRWQEECNRKLVPRLEKGRQYFEFNVKERLKGDTAAQTEHYATMASHGFYTVDEVRALEGFNPLPNGIGKRSFIQGAMVPLDRIDEIIDAQVAKATPQPAPAPDPPAEPDADRDQRLVQAIVEGLIRALPPPPDPEATRAMFVEVVEQLPAPQLMLPPAPENQPAIPEAVAEMLGEIREGIAGVRDAVIAPGFEESTRRLLEWQQATMALLVGRLVRREIAHARKLAAAEPGEWAERVASFSARFRADALEELRPWLVRAQNGGGPLEPRVTALVREWADQAAAECLLTLAEGTMPGLLRHWESGRAEAKTALLMEALHMGRQLVDRKVCGVCGQTVEVLVDGTEVGHGEHPAPPAISETTEKEPATKPASRKGSAHAAG